MTNGEAGRAEQTQWHPSYAVVLVLLIGTLILASIGGESPAGVLGALVLASSTLVAILWVSHTRRATLLVVCAVLAVGVLSSAFALFFLRDSSTAITVTGFAILAIAGAGPILIGSDLFRQGSVTIQTVLGAVNIYLLIGLFFAVLYSTVVVLSPAAPFTGMNAMRRVDLYYYSFIVLTTVGLGDFLPASDTVRVLTIIEALLGQLYLVTVLALLVGKMGGRREPSG